MPRLRAPRVRALSAVLFVIALSALVGGIFGRDALATDDRVLEYQKTFSAALGAIESVPNEQPIQPDLDVTIQGTSENPLYQPFDWILTGSQT